MKLIERCFGPLDEVINRTTSEPYLAEIGTKNI